jgi:phosphoribosylanthranilate isomerase
VKAAAINAVQPWGVDVSSGVEAAPGERISRKVREFIEDAAEE